MNSSYTLSKPKSRSVAVALALAGVVIIPGLHKFYLGQPGWGIVYLLLWFTPIPRIASAVEGVWYLTQDSQTFSSKFNAAASNQTPTQTVSQPTVSPEQISAIADALRQLDQLRQDGLISEYEFEQKRRCLLDKIE